MASAHVVPCARADDRPAQGLDVGEKLGTSVLGDHLAECIGDQADLLAKGAWHPVPRGVAHAPVAGLEIRSRHATQTIPTLMSTVRCTSSGAPAATGTLTPVTTSALPATAGVIGLGRFGRLWASMLQPDFTVSAYDIDPMQRADAERLGISTASLHDTLASDAVFYCIPISSFETTIKEHLPHFHELGGGRTLIDVLSVKVHAREVFERHLPADYHALLTHPLFGPDSVAASGVEGQTIVLDGYRLPPAALEAWSGYFESKGLVVVPMSADEHDRLAAESQGVTHFVGRTLERFGFVPTPDRYPRHQKAS